MTKAPPTRPRTKLLEIPAGDAIRGPETNPSRQAKLFRDPMPERVEPCLATLASKVPVAPHLAEAGARMLASTLTAAFLKDRVKAVVSRTRPRAVLEGYPYVLKAGNDPGKDEHSFPSGHTSGAVAAARAWARTYPETAVWAYAGAAVVAVVQLPRGKHYPADLVAGMIVGIASEAVVAAAATFVRDHLGTDDAAASDEHGIR